MQWRARGRLQLQSFLFRVGNPHFLPVLSFAPKAFIIPIQQRDAIAPLLRQRTDAARSACDFSVEIETARAALEEEEA